MEAINQGRALAKRLRDKIRQDGLSQLQLAQELGVSAGQVSKLLSRKGSFAHVSEEVLRAVARYLEIPVVQCFVLAGRLRHADFFQPVGSPLAAAMEVVVTSDLMVGLAIAAEDLQALPEEVQLLILRLHCGCGAGQKAPFVMSPWLERWLFGSSSAEHVGRGK